MTGDRERPRRDIAAEVRRLSLRYVPIVGWLPAYPREWLRPDLVASVTSWGVMVPVALAYAGLAGVQPEVGLTTAFAALTAYAIFGTSRHLKVTTSSTMAIMSAAVVGPIAQSDPTAYLALSAALALIVGLILLVAGLVRLGFISEFLAKPVVSGFVVGLAITIIVGQLPKLFGVPGGGETVFNQIATLIDQLPETNPWTLAIGAGSLLLIVVLRAISPRIPAPLIALVLGIGLSTALDLASHGVSVVGQVTTGVPTPGLPRISLLDIPYLTAGAAGIVFLAVGESLGAGRAFASRHGYTIDADQELIALGTANLASGLFSGFTVDASLSQSATGETAGGRSQVASLVTAGLILATAVVLAPLFANLPNAVLGAIVIAAVASLVDVAELRRYFEWRRTDFLLAMAALVGVVTTTVLVGLVIAVLLSLTALLYRASRPYIAILGRLRPEEATYVDLGRHPNAEMIPGLLIVRIDAPLYFFNANVAHDQILGLVASADPPPTVVVLDIGASSDFDVTTTDVVRELARELGERSIRLWLAQVKGAVRDRLRRTGTMDVLGEDRIFLSVGAAVEAFGEGDASVTRPATSTDAASTAAPVS